MRELSSLKLNIYKHTELNIDIGTQTKKRYRCVSWAANKSEWSEEEIQASHLTGLEGEKGN
jgi:hypothetical protein